MAAAANPHAGSPPEARKFASKIGKVLAKAALTAQSFNQKTLDPSIIHEEGFKARIEAFLRQSQVSEVAATYACQTQPKAQPDQLVLGWDGRVGLWRNGSVVNFVAFAGGFPTKEHAIYAAYRLNEAAQHWNDIKLGVTFKWVSKLEDAEFVLAYGGEDGGTLARAFFPNTSDLNTVFVYKRAFDKDSVNYQANIFTHELGHVLGLRHEFAPEQEAQTQPVVLLGAKNPTSVMSYSFPPTIQQTDIEGVRLLYQAPDGSKIQNFPVDRIEPDN